MCVTISVKRGGEFTDCDTVGRLAEVLGVPPETVSPDPPRFCLCNAHFDRLKAVRNEVDWWPEYIIDLDPLPGEQAR